MDWLQFISSLAWPALIVAFILLFRDGVGRLVNAITDRIERGDNFEASTSGVKLSAGPPVSADKALGKASQPEEFKELPHLYYLVHKSKRDRSYDRDGERFYSLKIWLDADESHMLNDVDSVTYHLHPTFDPSTRKIDTRSEAFALKTAAWGEFNMFAEIRFKDGRPPLRVERYINF
ncbi:MAG: hypothetical protein IT565_07190 [Rhodospirillales bacterium]|nr:hypothetical protein [Rhodospirillales bacterium]